MITRVSQLRIDPARADEAEVAVRTELAPAVLGQPGAIAGRWMLDGDTGEVLIAVQWSDEDAMFAAGAALADVRDNVVGGLRATPTSVQVHEVIGVAVETPLTLDSPAWSHVVLLGGVGDDARADAAALFRILADEHHGKPGYTGTAWSADFVSGTALCVSTWTTIDEVHAGVDGATAVWQEIGRALSATVEATSLRRTVASTPTDHVVDLTTFDRVAARLSN